jgi:hypothetical protein
MRVVKIPLTEHGVPYLAAFPDDFFGFIGALAHALDARVVL